MSEDFGDKTEAPTPQRRREARERGNVARTQDLAAAALLLGAMLLLKAFGPGLIGAMRTAMAEMLGPDSMASVDAGVAGDGMMRAVLAAGWAVAPVLAGLVVIAVAANVAQVGFAFNGGRVRPSLGALKPFKGAGRRMRPGQVGLNALKLAVIGVVGYSAVHGRLGEIVALQGMELIPAVGAGASIVFSAGLWIGAAMLALAVADYAYQRWRLERELRMTKQEVKEELRRMEGDPAIKARRRQVARQMATRKLDEAVPTADVVVAGPGELAVALQYDADTMPAPRVVARGRDATGRRIREVAVAAGVPVVERKTLARALYDAASAGRGVPAPLYAALADVFAYVHELDGAAAATTW